MDKALNCFFILSSLNTKPKIRLPIGLKLRFNKITELDKGFMKEPPKRGQLNLLLESKPKQISLRLTLIFRPRPLLKFKTDTTSKLPRWPTFFLPKTFKHLTYFAPELSITFKILPDCTTFFIFFYFPHKLRNKKKLFFSKGLQ